MQRRTALLRGVRVPRRELHALVCRAGQLVHRRWSGMLSGHGLPRRCLLDVQGKGLRVLDELRVLREPNLQQQRHLLVHPGRLRVRCEQPLLSRLALSRERAVWLQRGG
jgi:hypothetical protein